MATDQFYKAHVEPHLRSVEALCEEKGCSFVGMVELRPSKVKTVYTLSENLGPAALLTNMAVKARGNIDALMKEVCDYAIKNGHNSDVLWKLGIPTTSHLGERQ